MLAEQSAKIATGLSDRMSVLSMVNSCQGVHGEKYWWRSAAVRIRRWLMMINFWLAARFGRVWLRARKRMAGDKGHLPDECMLVARGASLTAGRLLRAETFAADVWWGAGMAVCGLFVIAPVAAFAIRGQLGGDIAAWAAGAAGTLAALFMCQMGVLRIQSYRLLAYLHRSGLAADDQPLAPGAPGRPRPRDYWVTLAGSAAVMGLLFYAGLQAAAGH